MAKKKPLSDEAYEKISEWIMDGTFKPGEALVEGELAAKLNISRTPVREVINRLETEGLLERIPHRGVIVANISLQNIKDFFEIREMLEGLAARKTAGRQFPVEKFEFFHDQFGKIAEGEITDAAVINQLSDEFHDQLVESSGNVRISQILSNYKTILRQEREIANTIPGRYPIMGREHRDICKAILDRDEEAAEKKMREHIISTRNTILLNL